MDKKKEYTVRKSECGFYSVYPLPSQKELEELYKDYYHTKKEYQLKYSDEEIKYFHIEAIVAEHIVNGIKKKCEQCRNDIITSRTFLDVGAGEGFFAKHFYENNWDVVTCDFFDVGMAHHNPELLDTLIRGNIFLTLEAQILENICYDFINIKNTLEHVIDPEALLSQIRLLMNDDSILRIEVPNDYSVFQQMLVKNDMTENTWFAPPEHLHYFSFSNIQDFLKLNGFAIESIMVDFPIELYILNPESNYAKNKALGKNAHLARVQAHNFIYDQGIDNYIDYFSSAVKVNMGRQIIVYVSKKNT